MLMALMWPAQTALVTSSLVLVDDAFVSHAVDHRYSGGEGGLGFFQVLGVDGFHDVLDVGAHHGAQAGVVAATLPQPVWRVLAEGVLATVELLEKTG